MKALGSKWVCFLIIEILFIIKKNNSFLDYLQQLNDTGSFPDESDKTPMVFHLFL